MSGGKASPRQKMINMMYLVLTALLAMNVQKSVLDAFTLINRGLIRTTKNFAEKNESSYNKFVKAAAESPEKHGPWKTKAFDVKSRSENLIRYIDDLKFKMIAQVDKIEDEKLLTDDYDIQGKDNTDIAATLMIFESKGTKLKEEIENYREFLVTNIRPQHVDFKEAIAASLVTKDPAVKEDGTVETWESERFSHLPFIAVVTSLSQTQSEIRHAEAEIITYLEREIDAGAIPVNKIDAIVIPKTNYVIRGDTFYADIFLAASDTMNAPHILIGEVVNEGGGIYSIKGPSDSINVRGGRGKMKKHASAVGEQEFDGTVNLKTPSGIRTYPFHYEYTVAEPSVNVSPDKMNVFYIGPDNPVTVSASGFAADKVKPVISGGGSSIIPDGKSGAGKYIVRVATPGLCKISVQVELSPGKSKDMGFKEFRVKSVPPPSAFFMGKKGDDVIKSSELKVAEGVIAKLENFDFDLKFTVTSFDVSMSVGGVMVTESNTGNRLSDKVKNMFSRAQRGGRVYIENVKARQETPGQKPVSIPGVNLKVI